MFTSYQMAGQNPCAVNRMVRQLNEADRVEVLRLLSEDPLHSVNLRSMIEDNGFDHPSNRGRFVGYFEDNYLYGVALLGHATILYAKPEVEQDALTLFAETVANSKTAINVIFGPQAQVEFFWSHLARFGYETRMVRDFRWYDCQQPAAPLAGLRLRRASQDEFAAVAEAQAEMFREATGQDPRDTDAAGFHKRVAERIDRKRTWVSIENRKAIFKTEIQSLTEEVAYLEGVWTHPDYRNQGVAKECLSELVHRLLKQQLVVSLVVEADDESAIRLYEATGFVHTQNYQGRYLNPLA